MKRLVFLLALTPLASCIWFDGDGDTGDIEDCIGGAPTPEAPLTHAEAMVAGSALRMAATRAAWAYEPPAFGWTSAGCAAAGGTDVDADGWPDASATITLDSCSRPAYGGVFVADGSFTAADLSSTASFAHSASGTLTVTEPGFAPASMAFTYAGAQAATFASLDPQETLTYEMNELVIESTFDTVSSFTPDDGTWTGGPLEGGLLDFYGAWELELVANLKTLEIFQNGLVIDPACPERIVSGTISAEYGIEIPNSGDCSGPLEEMRHLDVRWNGCGDTTISHEVSFH